MKLYPSELSFSNFRTLSNSRKRYFREVLDAVSAGTFYNTFVKLPDINSPTPKYICNNPKLFPFLKHCLGALDGTHISCFTSAADRHAARDRKGGLSQNCLAVCSFTFRFLYFISGFDQYFTLPHSFRAEPSGSECFLVFPSVSDHISTKFRVFPIYFIKNFKVHFR